ncbi:LysR substrate binding domain-containing protein [Kribbella voronezhensis]|uniref:LysR substrate binding domain-containing protein n=1 Tax=Kribbella voronezhensis TaxID=2512212 RepID=A0A4R7SYR1_9ACTN|nr:LysR family substrate-binding domain-containing protein [Kribbella voronezhensis]TDU83628.1 LysR substrate binding domain-containing protein [Kribbella voronezhensis]
MTAPDGPASFRLAYVPGVTPTKWVRVWNERLPRVALTLIGVTAAEAADVVRAGTADAGLVRLPIDRTGLSAIPLYTETTVVVVPKDHLVTAADEVTVADLADEFVLHPLDDTLGWDELPGEPAFERPATTAAAIELVAAGAGVLVVPQSLARLHHRKDLTYRPVSDAPESQVALTWPEAETTGLMEQFIGIVRGRSVNSTRGATASAPKSDPKKKAASAKNQPAKSQAAKNQAAKKQAAKRQPARRGKPRGR